MFDFDAAVQAPFRMQPGLRRLGPGAAQLTPVAPGSRHQREKLAVLSAFASKALVARPGFDALPALRALAAQAAAEHPQHVAVESDRVIARTLGVAVRGSEVETLAGGAFGLGDEIPRCLAALPAPWRLAGLLSLALAEDFAIVDARDGTIPWLAVALPSHWAPEHKVGRHFADVHAPVADNALLIQASERLVALVAGPDHWERFVWNVTSHPRLHAHPDHAPRVRWPEGADAEAIGAAAWWRTERQTFIPLPALRQAVFTIQVDTMPLARAVEPPGRAARLHDAIASMSGAVLAYRGLTDVRAALLDWLAARR